MVQVPDEVVQAYSDRVVTALLGFAEVSSIVLGDGLGWYAALAGAGAGGMSSAELAAATGTQERYAREWLEQQAVAGLLGVVPDRVEAAAGARGAAHPGIRFSLPPGAAEVLLQRDSLSALLPMVRMLRAGTAQLPQLLAAYRNGGGVGWAEIGDEARESQADGNKPWFNRRLGPALASVPDIHSVLSRPGAHITDLGAGCGWSTLALANAYPGAAVVGIDIDGPSIESAQANARSAGLQNRATFRTADAADPVAPASQDAVFIFEALHDMPFPVQVLASVRAMVKPDGVVVVMDEAVADAFAPDGDELERLMYAYSLFICLPDSLSTEGSAGTGTVMRQAVLEGYATEAGFSSVERLPIEGFSAFRFYRLQV